MCSQCSLQSWGFWHPLYWVSTPIGNHKAIGTTCITGYKVTAYEVRYYDITLSKFSTSNRCCVTSLYKKIKQFCKSVVLKKYIYKNYPGVPFFCNVNLWTHTQKKKEVQGLTWGTCIHKSISTKILSLRFMMKLWKLQLGVVIGIPAKVPQDMNGFQTSKVATLLTWSSVAEN